MYDVEELARAITKTDQLDDPEENLLDCYGLTLDQFSELVDDLLPYTFPLQHPLSNTYHHSFGRRDGTGWVAIVWVESTDPELNP